MNYFENEFKNTSAFEFYNKLPHSIGQDGEFVFLENKKLLNFSSKDFLNLKTNKSLVEDFVKIYPLEKSFLSQAVPSQSVNKQSNLYKNLEDTLALLFNKESALLFNSGYKCITTILSSLLQKGDVIYTDSENNKIITDGTKLSEAEVITFKHLDYGELENLLKENSNKYKKSLIVSESVFSISGEFAEINRLIQLKEDYNAILMIDETNAFCSIDDNFAGISDGKNVDIVTGNFEASLNSYGGFVVSNKTIINYLLHKSDYFIFNSAIPEINIRWTEWLLKEKQDIIAKQKQKLLKIILATHKYLKSSDIETVSESHIIPLVIKDKKKVIKLAEDVKNAGFFVLPVVDDNHSQLLLSLSANTDFEYLKSLIDFLKDDLK